MLPGFRAVILNRYSLSLFVTEKWEGETIVRIADDSQRQFLKSGMQAQDSVRVLRLFFYNQAGIKYLFAPI